MRPAVVRTARAWPPPRGRPPRTRSVSATSLRAAVTARMSSLPSRSRTPIRSSSLSWKLCRIGSTRPARRPRGSSSASSARRSARSRGWFRTRLSSSSSIMPGLLMRISDRNWLSHRVDVQLQARRVEAEQLPQHRLGAQRRGHLLQVVEGQVRVGRVGDRPQQLRGDAGQEVPAPAAWTGTALLLGQPGQVLAGGRHVAERVAAEDRGRPSPRPGRGRGSGRSPARPGRRSVGERLVQQVVEDGAVEPVLSW